jgi:hypothetical protein
MIVRHMIALCSLTVLCGCSSTSPEHTGEDVSQTIEIEVVTAEEHLGHNIDESGGHTVWCDGCKARVVPSGEPFVIYWINNAIENSNFRFKTGQKYKVLFAGEVGTGVMAYEGMCIDLQQILKLEEE